MKRCPICGNTFDDSMRFCQLDGAALVDGAGDVLPVDDDETKALNYPSSSTAGQTTFDEPKDNAFSPFGDVSSTNIDSSPFSNASSANSPPFGGAPASPFDLPDYKIDSTPFGEPPPSNYGAFDEAQNQYGQPLAQSSWTPPPAPDAGWQSQNIGANTPFAPPVVGAQGQNQTLPILSLVFGILGFVLVCCWGGIPFGLAASIMGFIAMQNVKKDPMQYGGNGLALAGTILGGIAFLLGVLILILAIFGKLVR